MKPLNCYTYIYYLTEDPKSLMDEGSTELTLNLYMMNISTSKATVMTIAKLGCKNLYFYV